MTVQEFLTQKLLPSYKSKTFTFNAILQEEYMLIGTPFLDRQYICRLAKTNMSSKVFAALCVELFGTDRFNYVATPEEDITEELFKKYYTFGTYPYPRHWISHFGNLNIFITRRTLWSYLDERRNIGLPKISD